MFKRIVLALTLLLMSAVAAFWLLQPDPVQIEVELKLEGSAEPGVILPVYVYAATPGSKLPLSYHQTSTDKLPIKIVLREDMYLLPSHTMKGADELVVIAKLSASGDPHKTEPGDVSVVSEVINPRQKAALNIELTLPNPIP